MPSFDCGGQNNEDTCSLSRRATNMAQAGISPGRRDEEMILDYSDGPKVVTGSLRLAESLLEC